MHDSQSNTIQVCEYFLKPGYLIANREETVVRTVLGNCVSVLLFDRLNQIGGANHFILPATNDRKKATAQYGNVAVTALVRMLKDMGSRPGALEAQIVGGAKHRYLKDDDLGQQNVEVARRVLRKFGVRIVSEDVGGFLSRKILYHTGSNDIVIIKGEATRREDWFLPGDNPQFHGWYKTAQAV